MEANAIRTLVVPTDFSESAERATVVAVDWAHKLSATIHLLHVWRAPRPSGGHWGASYPVALAQEMETAAKESLEALRQRIAVEDVIVSSELACGDPSLQIVACAARKRADLIVMGTRGQSGLPHVVLGSVAERTVRRAPCPVMTVGLAPARV